MVKAALFLVLLSLRCVTTCARRSRINSDAIEQVEVETHDTSPAEVSPHLDSLAGNPGEEFRTEEEVYSTPGWDICVCEFKFTSDVGLISMSKPSSIKTMKQCGYVSGVDDAPGNWNLCPKGPGGADQDCAGARPGAPRYCFAPIQYLPEEGSQGVCITAASIAEDLEALDSPAPVRMSFTTPVKTMHYKFVQSPELPVKLFTKCNKCNQKETFGISWPQDVGLGGCMSGQGGDDEPPTTLKAKFGQ